MADYYRKSVEAVCPDGKVRKVRARAHCYDGSLAADTFFSVPAGITYRGRYIHGYVTGADDDAPAQLEFRNHTACPWPGLDG